MKMGMYAIRDAAIGVYKPPFVQHNNAHAMRNFGDLANDPNTEINKHPSDYCLVRVGEWDDDQGTLHPEEHHVIAWAVDIADGKPQSTETQIHEPVQPGAAGKHSTVDLRP